MGSQKLLYKMIIEELKAKMDSGELQPNQLLPTELELARIYKVSRITSKRALEELEREGLIIRKRGVGSCVASQQYKNTSDSDTKIIAMVFPYKSAEGWVMDYVRGASDFLEANRCYLRIRCSDNQSDQMVLRQLVREPVSGIIYLPDSTIENEELLATMLYGGLPIVTIDKHYDGIDISSVTSDNRGGILQVMSYLIDAGHRNIGFFSCEPISRVTSVRDRYMAYCQSLVEHGLPLRDGLVMCFNYEEFQTKRVDETHLELVSEKLKRLMDEKITAVVAENDITALYLYLAAKNLGISVPDDLSITGFDDLPLLRQFDVNMTTIKQDFYGIGHKAAEILYNQIAGKEKGCVRYVQPVELLIRSTTKSLD